MLFIACCETCFTLLRLLSLAASSDRLTLSIFHTPSTYDRRVHNMSRAMFSDAIITSDDCWMSFDPSTSCHFIGTYVIIQHNIQIKKAYFNLAPLYKLTSTMGIPSLSATYINSMSKDHLSRFKFLNSTSAALLENNLNPHCVSWMFFVISIVTNRWNPYIRIVRWMARRLTESFCMWALHDNALKNM